jgi:hypothetical protein
VECPRCTASLPEVAHFCHVCGTDLVSQDGGRKASFALKPDEPVASFALVSTIMPRGVTGRPNTYRLALEVTLALVALTAIVGAVPIAVMIAAFAVPVVYIVYLYDVNLWEDEPVTVTGAAFVLTLALSIGWTLIWVAMNGHNPVLQVTAGVGGPTVMGFLIAGVLAPIVGEIIREAGPIFLASRPKFDDLMDGLTFGVISGVAYATGDTLVKHWALITGGFSSGNDGGAWLALLVLEGFIKPLVIGTATGIACAEFSGLGEGYDGFTNRYFRGFGEAVLASVLYFGGTYLLSFVPNPVVGTVLSILYGLVLLGVLLVRVRTVLHKGLLEAALESQARNAGVGPDGVLAFCGRCEMPLLPGAAFCGNCGTSVLASSHLHSSDPVPVPVEAAPLADTSVETPASDASLAGTPAVEEPAVEAPPAEEAAAEARVPDEPSAVEAPPAEEATAEAPVPDEAGAEAPPPDTSPPDTPPAPAPKPRRRRSPKPPVVAKDEEGES